MKKTLIALLLIPGFLYSQVLTPIPQPGEAQVVVIPAVKPKPGAYKFPLRSALFGFGSGAAWGIHETCVNWPDRIPPSWNERFWDNRVSWENKWKRGEDGQLIQPLTPRFWGSSTFLVATTDAKHLFASVHRWGMMGAGISIGIGQKRPWWHYAADVGISALAYGIGFQTAVFAFKL